MKVVSLLDGNVSSLINDTLDIPNLFIYMYLYALFRLFCCTFLTLSILVRCLEGACHFLNESAFVFNCVNVHVLFENKII